MEKPMQITINPIFKGTCCTGNVYFAIFCDILSTTAIINVKYLTFCSGRIWPAGRILWMWFWPYRIWRVQKMGAARRKAARHHRGVYTCLLEGCVIFIREDGTIYFPAAPFWNKNLLIFTKQKNLTWLSYNGILYNTHHMLQRVYIRQTSSN